MKNLNGWKWISKDLDELWMDQYNKVDVYFKKYKKLPQTRSHPLTSWLYKQRKLELEGKLPSYRYDLLDALGFSWGVQNTKKWDTKYKELSDYLIKNNNVYPLNRSSLGRWVAHQREYYRDKNYQN